MGGRGRQISEFQIKLDYKASSMIAHRAVQGCREKLSQNTNNKKIFRTVASVSEVEWQRQRDPRRINKPGKEKKNTFLHHHPPSEKWD